MASLLLLASAVLNLLSLLNDSVQTAALPVQNDMWMDATQNATVSGSRLYTLFLLSASTLSLLCLVALSTVFGGVCARHPTRVSWIDHSSGL